MNIRLMRREDLAAVFALQCRAHPEDYHEPVHVLASRLEFAPESCFVAERAGDLAAYVFAHPWAGPPPELHKLLPRCLEPDHVFIHDLAVCPMKRGCGVAEHMLGAVTGAAKRFGYQHLRLVALDRAVSFWGRYGFRPSHGIKPGPSYGASVCMDGAVDL